MNCERYQELIISQIGGEIEAVEEQELKAHLEQCQSCSQSRSEFRAIAGLMRQMPYREWDEKLRIQELLRRNRRWQTFVFSKAALWLLAVTAFLSTLAFLPLQWELSSNHFSVRWVAEKSREAELTEELKKLQIQLSTIQRQNQDWRNISEARFKQLLKQNNVEQQKLYWQSLEMYTNYLQLQHRADVSKIQHDIAATYDRTGQEVERTNQLLEYVLRASATDSAVYGNE